METLPHHTLPIVSEGRATLIGYSAILMWATLPLLAALAGNIPPFQITGLSFTIAFTLTLLKWRWEGVSIRQQLSLPLSVWVLGIFGIFGFHFCYFIAFQNIPAIQALLIINLWPMLIVFLSSVVNGMPLRWWHIGGVLTGFCGVILITVFGEKQETNLIGSGEIHWVGYVCAGGCALIWSLYSVFSRRMASRIPRDAVGAYCAAAAVLSFICHLLMEETTTLNWEQAGLILIMGIGPIGSAFFTWDYGVRHGNIRTLGTLTYTGLLIGTILLMLFGFAPFSLVIVAAAGCIIGGALLSSLDSLRWLRQRPVIEKAN